MKKNILIIGGSGGIGLEIAKILAPENNVIIASRSKGNLEELDVAYHSFDVLKDDIKDLDLPDSIDGLVYCPGSINLKPFKMLKIEAFEEEMNLNFFSLVKVVQGLLPHLKNADSPGLIFFSTVAVQKGMPFHTSVAAAKGAIEGFARSLAAEYAPTFRVNVIAPSLTDTPLAGKLLSSEDKRTKMAERHPLQRIGSAKDIANMAEFLLSSKSSWMTGQVLGVDGGLSSLNMN
ncbi:oxidoreductase [Antarcticibacterium sp. W02-3]|uniref:SDR family NAD(P)-dependent oxidoreductase n=1 Tax=Antarcticibacterium sp. W02-3 TaxID=2183747 RepID=UPI002042DB55|nr:SDR family oxidoreductase [Antarcticibacterium sp. W02-3]MCM4159024.1 oxidoreductase [Antarcticibacterium sp. W02-3]